MKKFNSLQDVFLNYCRHITDAPLVNSRGSTQRELLFESFEITDPTAIDIKVEDRKFSTGYALTEWLWYLSCDRNTNNIGKMAKIWNQISDNKGEVESNYGTYIAPQWSWILGELTDDRDSRRATIVINQVHHKFSNEKDYPCTQYIQFFIRENKLHMGVNMRSNDLIFGLCNDVFTFCLFHQLMLNDLNDRGAELELGSYFHHAGSLHVYERHFNMVSDINSKNHSSEECRRFELSSGVTMSGCPVLPQMDMPKEEIQKYTKSVKEKIFREYS